MKIRVSGKTQQKLAFVKAVKYLSGMGLKDSKELVDSLDSYGSNKYIEFEILPKFSKEDIVQEFEPLVGININLFDREHKLKRILYTNQETCIRDLMESVLNWEKVVSAEDKNRLSYTECKEKAFQKIYNEFSEFIKVEQFTETYQKLKKSSSDKSLEELVFSLIRNASMISDKTEDNDFASRILSDVLLILSELEERNENCNIGIILEKIKNLQ